MLEMKVGKTKIDKSEITYKYLNQKNGLNIYLDAYRRLEKYYKNGITVDFTNLNPFKDKITYEEFVVLHHGYFGENTVMLRKVKELLEEKLYEEFRKKPIEFMIKYHPKYAKQILPEEKLVRSILENFKKMHENNNNTKYKDVKEEIIKELKAKLKKTEKEIEKEFSDKVSSLYSIEKLFAYIIDTEPLVDEFILKEALYRLSVSWESVENRYYEIFYENDEIFHRNLWGKSPFGKELFLSQIKNALLKENIHTHIQNFLNGKTNKPLHIFFTTSKMLPTTQLRALYYWIIHQMNQLINELFEEEKYRNKINTKLNEELGLHEKNPKKSVLHKKWFSDKYINYTVTYIANNFLRGNVKSVWPYLGFDKKDGNSNLFLNVYQFEKIPPFIRKQIDVWKLYEPKTKKEYTELKHFLSEIGADKDVPALNKLSQVKSYIAKVM